MNYVFQFVISFLSLAILDLVWLGVIMKKHFSGLLGNLLLPKVKLLPTIGVYLILAAVVVLIISHTKSVGQAALYGALAGFAIYGVYEFTNFATIVGWPARLIAIDILWGTFACGIVSALVFKIFIK